MPYPHLITFLFVSALFSTADASFSCKEILANSFAIDRHARFVTVENTLDGREYREAAIQVFNKSFYEAVIIHAPFSAPTVVINHFDSGKRSLLDRARNLFKKQEPPSNQWITQAIDIPGATTIAEMPNHPGQFVVGKLDGTLQLVSMDFQNPRLGKTENGEVIVWSEIPPHSFVSPKLENFSEYIFTEREKKNTELFNLSTFGSAHNPAITLRRNNFAIVKNPKAIISLYITKDGTVWYRNISSEIHAVDLYSYLNP